MTTTPIARAVATYLAGTSEQHLHDIVAHGIHNLTNEFQCGDDDYDAYQSEFARQAHAALDLIDARRAAMARLVDQYTVEACASTGEWLGEPQYVGRTTLGEWAEMTDSDEVHYDTYERDGETRAIEVVFVSE